MIRSTALAFLVLAVSGISMAAEIDFNRDVRPILSDNCFYCHGPDEETQEADLRIDLREHALANLGGYAAIVPGKPEESEIYLRLTDPDDPMPPEKSKKIVTKEEKETIRKWIEQGAEYDGHWAFEPVSKAEPPEISKPQRAANPIDQFVVARLDSVGLEPSAEADREILIRRAYVDVVGLLPTPEEVDAFVADESPEAWDKLIDLLLASPHYGERWGRHWLDQARYADSHGYSADHPRVMWPYRDWVIKAINDDMSFDQFTIEQIAGDLLYNPTKSQLIATAFHRNTLINQEGGSDPEQFRVESVIDRVNTTGAVWLGLTLACAQCHTHKFDPIPHQEYYEFSAFFNNTSDRNNAGRTVPVEVGEVGEVGEVFRTGEEQLQLSRSKTELEELRTTWEKSETQRLVTHFEANPDNQKEPDWHSLQVDSASAEDAGIELQILDGGSVLLGKGHGKNDTLRVGGTITVPELRAVRLRVLTHDSLPKNGPGAASNGNFVLTDLKVLVDGESVALASAVADHQQDGYTAAHIIDDNPKTGWAINVSKNTPGATMNAPHEVVLTLAQPIHAAEGKTVEVRLFHGRNENYLVGHFAIDLSADLPAEGASVEREFLTALQVPSSKRDGTAKKLLDDRFHAVHPEARPSKLASANLMIMGEQSKPRETYILTRGDFTRPDKERGQLHPGGISAIAPAFPAVEGRTRLDLARWLVDPANPLTPRVTMNRLWMRYFGIGLVETEEDFGTQGTPPSHPKLLDWLAAEFIQSGWSMKHMHRLVLTSATYRQSSHHRADLQKVDARNLLLARQNRVRMDAEIVRDAALSASGLLDRSIGGPSVHPPQPGGVYSFTQVKKKWPTARGGDRYRRAMYTMFYRSAPYPLFTTFDAPDFSAVCTRRGRSNTPLQALMVANDPVFLEFAQGLAGRLLEDAEAGDSRIILGFKLALGRAPSDTELVALRHYASEQFRDFQANPEAAAALLNEQLKDHSDASEVATLVCLARAILNTDNFITRE